MQLAHRLREILHLGEDEVLEVRCVRDEGVGSGNALDRRVEPGEPLVRDARGDLRAVPPGQRILVRDEHLVRLADRELHGVPVEGRRRAEVDNLYTHDTLYPVMIQELRWA